MAYAKDALITAADFNALRDTVLNVYGTGFGNYGYGQTGIVIPSVSQDTIVDHTEWRNLRDAVKVCLDHQGAGSNIPASSNFATDQTITYHQNLDTAIQLIHTNHITGDKLNYAAGAHSVFLNQLVSQRTTSWSTTINHDFTVTFPTADDARYFFNTGGEIRIRMSRTGGGGSPHNVSWTSIFTAMGTLKFNLSKTYSSNSVGTEGVGYYGLSTGALTSQMLYQLYDGGTYGGAFTANSIKVYARTSDGPTGPNGDNGRIIQFRILLDDAYVGTGDTVTGTVTSRIDIQRATNFLTVAGPSSLTTTSSL